MMAKTMTALASTVLLAATSAWAQSEPCRGDARTIERDLTLRGNQIAPQDRMVMEQRLSMSSDLCSRDPSRAGADLEQLRRDMVLQAERPRTDTPPDRRGR